MNEKQLKELLYNEQKGKCMYCGAERDMREMHLDHKMPKSRDGVGERKNRQILCGPCNLRKSYFSDGEYREIFSESKLLVRAHQATGKPPANEIRPKRFDEVWDKPETKKKKDAIRKRAGIDSKWIQDYRNALNLTSFR